MNLSFIRVTDRYLGIPLCYLLNLLTRAARRIRKSKKSSEVKKILMVKFWGIGNLVMILPTVKAVREHYPCARIDLFTLFVNRDVLQQNPLINNIYFLEHRGLLKFVCTYLANALKLRRERYDMVLDFEQFAKTSSVFGLLIGARERIGFDTPGQGRGIAYTRRVAYLDYTHMVETFFRIAKGAGVEKADLSPVKLDVTGKEREKVKLFLEENGIVHGDIVVGVHVGTGDNMMTQRRWGKEKFAELADILISRHNAKIVFTGAGDEEAALIGETLSMMKNHAIDASNKFTVTELAAFTERCKFFISNDTALVHIASAMGTPVVGIFGPNTPYLYGPRGRNDLVFYKDMYCSPCITNYNSKISSCKDPVCTESITVAEVADAIKQRYLASIRSKPSLRGA